jgi:hypothetical protein
LLQRAGHHFGSQPDRGPAAEWQTMLVLGGVISGGVLLLTFARALYHVFGHCDVVTPLRHIAITEQVRRSGGRRFCVGRLVRNC